MHLALAAQDAGYDVAVVTHVSKHGEAIRRAGIRLIPFNLSRRGMNPLSELAVIARLIVVYRKEKPDIVHHVSMKPVLYGSLAARLSGVPRVVNALAGLGFIFVAQGWKVKILRRLVVLAYCSAFSAKNTVGIFQNPEDLKLFTDAGIAKREKVVMIRSSGVDIIRFIPRTEPENIPIIVLASRMLQNKGIGEFVEAAKMLKNDEIGCRMVLVGNPDSENPASIWEETLRGWHSEGIVEWWGHREDMPEVFAQSNIVVLPTAYGEGVPKVLLEAASCGRAIVTTDVPGCREIVKHGVNGLLVPPKDAQALANAIQYLIENPGRRREMGMRGRDIVVKEFSEEIVFTKTLAVYQELLAQ